MTRMHRTFFYYLPWILYTLAVCYLVSLLFTIREDVFFSGDAGLKYLMVKQIAGGGNNFHLQLQAPLWVSEIWSNGFYPFKEPFVYDAPGGKIVSFPPSFQWITAALYKYSGFKGLYAIPVLSLVFLWAAFILVLQKKAVSPVIISTGFLVLAFCSPLTVYGALYWEHTMAIACMFAAVSFMLLPASSSGLAVLSGIVAGCSVWLRPECLLLCVYIMAIMCYRYLRLPDKRIAYFNLSLLLAIMAFLSFNYYHYEHILGAHGFQVAEPTRLKDLFPVKFAILLHLNARLIIYFPAVLMVFAFAANLLFKRAMMPSLVKELTCLVIVFLLSVPWLLPNAGGKQWGPRYLLPAIPLIITLLCLATAHFKPVKAVKQLWFLPVLLIAYSIYINVFVAHSTLKNDYAYRVKPSLDFLLGQKIKVVVVQNQFIAQEFAALFGAKYIFLAEDQVHFHKLAQNLKSRQQFELLFIAHDSHFRMLPFNLLINSAELKKSGDYYIALYNLE